MTIALTLPNAADIEDYEGLKAFLVAHLQLDAETEAQLPNLIRMAEYRLDRLLTVPQRESIVTLVFGEGDEYASLPSDLRNIRLVRSGAPLLSMSLADLRERYNGLSGTPVAYAIANQSLYVAPTPGSTMAVEVVYTTKLPRLSDGNTTNWLLSENADAYVYACLIQCEAFLGNNDRLPLLDSALVETMAEINLQGHRYRSGSPLVMRSRVVV